MPRLRFTLSMMLLAIAIFAFALGSYVNSLRFEHRELSQLSRDCPGMLWDFGDPGKVGPPSILKGSRVQWIGFVGEENTPKSTTLARLSNFRQLQAVSFSFTAVSLRHLECLPALPTVEEVDFTYCPQVSDSAIAILVQKMAKLRKVDLRGTAITDNSMVYLSTLRKLSSLNIAETEITGCTIGKLKTCNIEELILDETRLDCDVVSQLLQLTELRKLSISDTLLGKTSLIRLKGLNFLRVLILWGVDVNAYELRALKQALPMCRIVGP